MDPVVTSTGRSLVGSVSDVTISDSVSPMSSRRPSATDNARGSASRKQQQLFTDLDRGAPGDAAFAATGKRTPEEALSARRKNQFYGEVFAYRESPSSPRERVSRESMVVAEVKTNVIIADEMAFLNLLSSFLSMRYARPQSSILISLMHSSCLLLGGSFEPAYLLTLSALPSQVQATVNKRNAMLIQQFFADALSIPTMRGVIKFMAIDEACLATGGVTVLAEIEGVGKTTGPSPWRESPDGDNSFLGRSRARRKQSQPEVERSKLTSRSRRGSKDKSKKENAETGQPSRMSWAGDKGLSVDTARTQVPASELRSPADGQAEKAKKLGPRKSFMQMFGR